MPSAALRKTRKRTKNRRKTRRSRVRILKIHRQKGGFTDDELTKMVEIVKKYFETFKVQKDYYGEPTDAYTFEIKCTDRRVMGYSDMHPRVIFTIYPSKVVEIDYLTKCIGKTGAAMLRNIIDISIEWGASQITLSDASTFGCGIPLYIYHILKDGFSWYHKFGFVSEDDEKEMEHNEKIRNKPLSEFIHLILSNTSANPEHLLSRWHDLFPESREDPTIHDIIKKIPISEFMEDCDDPRTKLLEDTFTYAKKSGIQYKTKLHLVL